MDQLVKSFQDYLKTSPLGVKYTGLSDGYASAPGFKPAIDALTSIIKDKLSKSPNVENQNKAKSFAILSGDKIVSSVDIVKKIIDDIQKDQTAANSNIKSAQEVFNSNPFGLVYGGPKDGIMNPEFSARLKDLESKISEATGAQIIGKIVSGDNLVTDASDLSKTFSLISSYQKFIQQQKEQKK